MLPVSLVLSFLIFASNPIAVAASGPTCVSCHSSKETMQSLGYPHLTVTPEEVERQSGMVAPCTGCHRGNPLSSDPATAHAGITRFIAVKKQGLKGETPKRTYPFLFTGNPLERVKLQTEKGGKPVVDSSVAYLLYGDRRSDTLSVDFDLLKATCGTCHAAQYEEFTKSTKARFGKQGAYIGWTNREHGPHNCGAWFESSVAAISAGTTLPFTPQAAGVNQRTCNSCHTGCLDCHYLPQPANPARPEQGMHSFYRRPPAEACYGGGRGSTCHAGPEERRRGAGYFGGAYSYPEGATPDIHAGKGVVCLDCHEAGGGGSMIGHATVKRQATCGRCHQDVEARHARSSHKNLSCEACHIRNVGGYQATFWGPGKHAGVDTPFFKYKDYYGVMKEPFLIRDQRGRWIPVKPFPMAVMNQKTVQIEPGLHWRWPAGLPDLGRTDDAWGYAGIAGGLPENNSALLWVQMDKMSHKLGPSRTCSSCHELAGNEQRQTVAWEYSDQGALPFSGSHTVVGNEKGLFIVGIRSIDAIEPVDGRKKSAFAPWSFFPDKWVVKGDFSLPPLKDRKLYESAKGDPEQARMKLVVH